jgi:hypothetical protein
VKQEAARVASVLEAGGIDRIEVTGGMPESRERVPTKGINKHVFSKPTRCHVEEANRSKKGRRSPQLPD